MQCTVDILKSFFVHIAAFDVGQFTEFSCPYDLRTLLCNRRSSYSGRNYLFTVVHGRPVFLLWFIQLRFKIDTIFVSVIELSVYSYLF